MINVLQVDIQEAYVKFLALIQDTLARNVVVNYLCLVCA